MNFLTPIYLKLWFQISVPMSIEFEMLAEERENPTEEMQTLADFTDEEGYGKYLDMHECYDKYINLKNIEVRQW